MKGKLYGIGVGPGDPELLTIKAINTIKKCSVIAVPVTRMCESTALNIVEQYTIGKKLLECYFAMSNNMAKRNEARQIAAANIILSLEQGNDVGFITLGDPTTYSTYMYMHKIIADKDFETEIVPGITSYAAAAAELRIALCEGDEPLTIIPASDNDVIDTMLNRSGNKVIMKSGKNLLYVLEKLKKRGCGDNTKIVCRATMEGQRLYENIEDYEKSPESGYFTIAIIKDN